MNILLTRPLIDAEDLMGKFFSLGHKIIHIPTLKISAANIDPVDAKKYEAFIFTSANSIRNLKLNNKISISFETEKVLPAVGQGIIAVQCKKNDELAKFFLKNINDPETELCAKAERKMLQVIGGDCETAIGGLAIIENNNLKLKVQLFSDSGSDSFEHELIGKDTDAVNIGKAVGEKLLNLAGKEFKKNEHFTN